MPDVAFLSYARLPFDVQLLTDEPGVSPDAVVEVLSIGDRKADVEEKIRVYLAAGTAVILVDPERQIVTIRDAHGERTISAEGVLNHDALPGFRLNVCNLFSVLKPKC